VPGRTFESGDNRSEIARENLPYDVYVPPCYRESGRRFPLLILLHGLSNRQTQWAEVGLIDALEQGIRLGVLPPMIVAMPYYGNIGVRNAFPPDPSYESVLLDELLPALERDFCVYEDRDHRAVGGISRGGFWAYSLALRSPEIFGAAGAHSGYFPDSGGEVPAAFNPTDIARNSTLLPTANLRLYLDNAARDDAGTGQRALSDRLGARGIEHTYIINTVGEHNNDYWAAHVGEYLAFYGEGWPRDYNLLPSCLEPSP
jgi:enterochelin esterase-like enzyme